MVRRQTLHVVDDGWRPVGTLTEMSLRSRSGLAPYDLPPTAGRIALDPLSIPQHATVREALGTLVHRHARQLGVVDEEGRLRGVVHDLDILRWVARG